MTFSLQARHNGRVSWLERGDALSVEFTDGKGVSGRVADVSIAPGGLPFFVVVTSDGEWPDANPLREMIALIQAHGYVVQEKDDYAAGMCQEYERGRSEASDPGYTVEVGGQTFTSAQWEAVQAYARGTDAASEDVADDTEGEGWTDDRSDAENALRRVLKDVVLERDLARERVHELAHREAQLSHDLDEARDARNYWRRKAHSRLSGVDTIVVNVTNPRP